VILGLQKTSQELREVDSDVVGAARSREAGNAGAGDGAGGRGELLRIPRHQVSL